MHRRRFLKLASSLALAHFARVEAQNVGIPKPSPTKDARRLICRWQELKRGKFICELTETNSEPLNFSQLFVNGRQEILARFPDADPSGTSNYVAAVRFLPQGLIFPDFGSDTDSGSSVAIEFDPATFTQKRWAKPEEAVLRLKKDGGDLRIPIRAVDYDRNLIWCAPEDRLSSSLLHTVPLFYVENVYEELNAPHEWYLSRQDGILYYRPPTDVDMRVALVQAA